MLPTIFFFLQSRVDNGRYEHESYYGDRDTVSLIKVRTKLILNWYIDKLPLKVINSDAFCFRVLHEYICLEFHDLLQTMENLIAPIALENKSNHMTDDPKIPAPLTGGCRIEGFVRIKKVNMKKVFHISILLFLL